MSGSVQKRLFQILELAEAGDAASRVFDVFILTLISTNVIAVLLETIESYAVAHRDFLRAFELFSVAIFTVEYCLRLYSCTSTAKYSRTVVGRIRFAVTPLAIVDLMAILPFYLPMLIPLDLRFIRALRLLRLFRLAKIGRYATSLRIPADVLRAKKEELAITMFTVFLLLVISSSLMYYIENEAQPDAFSSIPAAMWWGVCTLTTVGYGDISPVTPLGKFLGSIISLLGIGVFALPAGILASGLVEAIRIRDTISKVCPHCGRRLGP